MCRSSSIWPCIYKHCRAVFRIADIGRSLSSSKAHGWRQTLQPQPKMHIPLLFLGVLVPFFLLLCLVQPTSAWPVVAAHPDDLRWLLTERLARRAPPSPVQPSVRVSLTRGRSNSPFQQNPLSGAGSGARDSDFNPITGRPVQHRRQEERLVGDQQNYPGHHFDSLLVPP